MLNPRTIFELSIRGGKTNKNPSLFASVSVVWSDDVLWRQNPRIIFSLKGTFANASTYGLLVRLATTYGTDLSFLFVADLAKLIFYCRESAVFKPVLPTALRLGVSLFW